MASLQVWMGEASVRELPVDTATRVIEVFEQTELGHSDHLVQIQLPDEGGNLDCCVGK